MSRYFLTTQRLGFRTWRGEDLDLAIRSWGNVDVARFLHGRGRLRPMSILKWLGFGMAEEGKDRPEAESVRRLVEALEELPPERARFLGAFAFILARVAHADLHISSEEIAEMERILVAEGDLPREQAALVVQIAKANRIFGATDDFLATREFKARSTRAERLQLLRCLFAVSAADDHITTVEEEEARRIANELGLDHAEYISIRSEYRDKRDVLKE